MLPTADDGAAADAPRPRPASLLDIFLTFNRLALQGFGGVLPVAQRELVERCRWITRQEFVEMLSVGQVLPGPNIVNVSLMIGDRFFGVRGALTALAGMLTLPLVIVLLLAALYSGFSDQPVVSGALRGMGAVAAGLVIATALKLMASLRRTPLGLPLAGALLLTTVLLIGALRWPLLWVIASLGPLGVALAWWKLSR